MFDKLSIPVKGEPPRAAWGAGVANRLNELCAMTPARALVRDGATGTGFASLPVNARGFRPSPSSLPWTFRCTEDPDTGERTGGWRECILQLGYHKFLFSGDLSEGTPRGDGSGVIAGTDLTDDGDYIVEVDTKNETAEIKLVEGNLQDDIPNSIVRIWIGEVRDGKQVSGIHHHPVVYKYI